jgi:hypothetical protein
MSSISSVKHVYLSDILYLVMKLRECIREKVSGCEKNFLFFWDKERKTTGVEKEKEKRVRTSTTEREINNKDKKKERITLS